MNSKFAFLISFLIINFTALLNAQLISSEPAFPTDVDETVIFFNATEGNEGLVSYSEDIYAHIGVITDKSTDNKDWKYVKTAWGENTPETKLTRISADYYSLTLSPSIREYFDVPENEIITHIAIVFRAHDNSKEGKDDANSDIYLEVYQEGLNVSIIVPDKNLIIENNSDVTINTVSSETALLNLYLNNSLVKTETGESLNHTINFSTIGDYWVKITAETDSESHADSVFIHAMDQQPNESMPEGINAGINYTSNSSVTLALYAPGKDNVFLIGDFNNWIPQSSARMKKDDKYFWLEIDNLSQDTEYAYQYFIDGEILLADPYTEKVLDPSNDKWISNQTYPNLKEYPSAFTNGNTSVFEITDNKYNWVNEDFEAPDKNNLVIYELLPRDFIANHDWKTLTDTLDYFSTLGITAIELMPVNEFEGNESWGYNPSFYFAPDKYYGPKEDLQMFIDSCHGRGIAVIIDMVLNHSFSQSPLVQLYFDDASGKVTADNPWYNVDSPNESYFWGYDFNHESPETKAFVDSVNSFWLTEYNVDGFRFDFTKGFTNTPGDGWNYDPARISILKRMADEIWNVNDNAYVIFEHLSDNSEETILADYGIMLWGNMNFNYNEATMGWHDSNKSDFSNISYQKRAWTFPSLVGYMESHDEERLMYKNIQYGNASGSYNIKDISTSIARIELAATFFFTIPGPKMIWQFGEVGYDYSIDENGRVGNKPIRWDYLKMGKRKSLYQLFSALIHLKNDEPAFSTDDYTLNLSNSKKRIELNHADMDVRIIGNFDVTEQSIDPNFSTTGEWFEFFSGDALNITDTHELIDLNPGEYRIYTTKQLEVPDISMNINSQKNTSPEASVFPNPASNQIQIQTKTLIQNICILDLNGRTILKENTSSNNHTLNIDHLKPGLYILKIQSINNQSINKKITIQ